MIRTAVRRDMSTDKGYKNVISKRRNYTRSAGDSRCSRSPVTSSVCSKRVRCKALQAWGAEAYWVRTSSDEGRGTKQMTPGEALNGNGQVRRGQVQGTDDPRSGGVLGQCVERQGPKNAADGPLSPAHQEMKGRSSCCGSQDTRSSRQNLSSSSSTWIGYLPE